MELTYTLAKFQVPILNQSRKKAILLCKQPNFPHTISHSRKLTKILQNSFTNDFSTTMKIHLHLQQETSQAHFSVQTQTTLKLE